MALLEGLLADPGQPFALVQRSGAGDIDVLRGEFTELAGLDEVETAATDSELLVLVPYRQIVERGFPCNDDHAPLLAMVVREHETADRDQVLEALGPEVVGPGSIDAVEFRFDVSDEDYRDIVRAVLADEIGAGAGSNFVISRSLIGALGPDHLRLALGLFRRLLSGERGAYWTYFVHTGTRTVVGASPEAHAQLENRTVSMNPISGTYRYPPEGPTVPGLLDFLADEKENDELFMVVDEELKMMSALCPAGGTVAGPYLKEMAHLAHTEYLLSGRTDAGVAEVLRETMFAPTVVGSPLESATHVVARYEAGGRGYYSGVIALVDRDPAGAVRMDSAILIRTAVIDAAGTARIGVGSTLVRNSDPIGEMHETYAKAQALINGSAGAGRPDLAGRSAVAAALGSRNAIASQFWFAEADARRIGAAAATRGSVLLIDAADNFTAMLASMLRSLGHALTIAGFDDEVDPLDYDLVLLGPGPGDPADPDDPRIGAMRRWVDTLLATDIPFAAVCLSHQILCAALGLDITRLDRPNQGVSREISLFGVPVRAGFYNTYVARSAADSVDSRLGPVEVSRDPETGEVYALRGERFASVQFHAESVLSQDGPAVLAAVVGGLIARPTAVPDRPPVLLGDPVSARG
ncbi:phenazine biosynthesis protein phzE [Nocardia transvalensis]|uniref:anthranilate synthase n=1 Tax=Nocardia transvalensis TaxID=37333 RepID=A0A7W9PA00_9NOCA|nr:anthranilate synthase family protein [Nocardia transvalensis]MBB5912156.1 phenazine biosynthesis protein phzE [Nocardia transvalensis]